MGRLNGPHTHYSLLGWGWGWGFHFEKESMSYLVWFIATIEIPKNQIQ